MGFSPIGYEKRLHQIIENLLNTVCFICERNYELPRFLYVYIL